MAMLVALAIVLQGVPLIKLDFSAAAASSESIVAAAPCHEDGKVERPGPTKSIPDTFDCCATFACGMLAQALPPDTIVTAPQFAGRYLRPTTTNSVALAEPDPAWRPPAQFI
jgi:hypothetical protein